MGDVNECVGPLHPCSHICSNTVGSYTCSCHAGFQLAPNHRECTAVKPCQISCGGGQCYIDPSGKERCMCDVGYRKTPGPLDECLDIQECVDQADMCREHAHSLCIEDEGKYACTCSHGYKLNPDGMSCSDVDECHEEGKAYKHKCDVASTTCVNTVGNYSCTCKDGFIQKNFFSCEDIDECAVRTHGCARHTAKCVNLPGSYECRCRNGYVGDGKTCMDVNECLDSKANTCSKEEICVNLQPLYECICKPGFKRHPVTHKCEDVNECVSPLLNKCSYASGCVNTYGSFHCSCQDGAVLANDGVTCVITNPCRNSATAASCKQLCLNVNGTDVCMCTYPLDNQCRGEVSATIHQLLHSHATIHQLLHSQER
ncbi:hypothetical protein NP493_1450g01017 [Ridgeia piscesae]|uniref:EGF-like domain-containing protein n=1 Tax=Ridgeia piscesae TaxID=27915 RepID=A0AAD9K3G0_RIDPI|nr:hypothetical protein NP493_1450g01017 [Ridgeia piscesae]